MFSLAEGKENYRLVYDALGKLRCIPVDEKDAAVCPAKILGIRQLHGGKTQYNLFGGKNLLVDKQNKDYKVGDSLVLDEKNAVKQHLPLKKGALVYFVSGRFQGTTAKVEDVQGKDIIVTTDKATAKTLTEYAFVVGEKDSVIKLKA